MADLRIRYGTDALFVAESGLLLGKDGPVDVVNLEPESVVAAAADYL